MKETMKQFTITGKSLLELREEYGVGKKGFSDSTWWLDESFAKEKPEAGIYEIEIDNVFNNRTYEEQKNDLPRGFQFPHPAVLSEAILSHYKKTKKRILENFYSRTSVVDSDGVRVYVGDFRADGLLVNNAWGGSRSGNLGVSAARKLNFENSKPFEISILEKLDAIIKLLKKKK